MNRNAASFEQSMCQCVGAVAALLALIIEVGAGAGSEIDVFAFAADDDVKPGGGSTPSAISSARCSLAFLSQSSIG